MEIRSNFLPRKAAGALTPGSSAGSSPSQSPSFTKRFSSHLPTRRRKQKHERESQQAAAPLLHQQLLHNQQHQQQVLVSDVARSVVSHDEQQGYHDEDDGAAACQARSLSRSYAAQAQILTRPMARPYPAVNSNSYLHAEKHNNPELPKYASSAVSKAREKEVAWLLETLRKEIGGLKELLRKCIAGTLPASGQTIGESLLLSSPRSEVIKGYCTLEGNSIVKADLTIKFPNTHKEAIRTQVAPFCPYYLKQLAAARNKANLALEALCAWPEKEFAVSRDVAEEIIHRVHSLISDGEYAMDQPPRLEPLLMTTVDAKIFQPPLPPTVVIAFTVQSSVLQATILSLGPSQTHQHYHHLLPHHHHHHHHHHHLHHAPQAAQMGASASSMLTLPPMFKSSGSSASLNSPAATLSSRTSSPPGLGPPGMAVTAAVVPSAAAAAAGGMAAAGIAASSAFSAATSAVTLPSSQPVVPPIVVAGATPLLPPPAAASVAPGRTIKVRGELMEVLEEILVESRSPRLESLMATLDRVKREVERWKGCLAAVA